MSSARGQMPVLEGASLEDYLQQFFAGISLLDPTLVRPRWQPEPPNIPDYGVDWCAFGITQRRPIGTYPWVGHHPEGDGWSELQRHEEITCILSFYGPQSDEYSQNLHNGLMIWQNFSMLRLVGMAFIEIAESIRAPELIKERWWERIDKTLTLRRIIRRSYPVLNLLSSSGQIITDPDGYIATWQTPHPAPSFPQAVGHASGYSFAVGLSQ